MDIFKQIRVGQIFFIQFFKVRFEVHNITCGEVIGALKVEGGLSMVSGYKAKNLLMSIRQRETHVHLKKTIRYTIKN